MLYAASYFVANQYLGRVMIESDFAPHSLAYCCSTCGEIWARVMVQGPCSPYWHFLSVPCAEHKPQGGADYRRIPGSLLDNAFRKQTLSKMWWAAALEHLPPQVLTYEFENLIIQQEKQNATTFQEKA